MKLPFSVNDFFEVMKEYNLNVFPAQIIFFLLAVFTIVIIKYQIKQAGILAISVLSILWFWMGIIYHWSYFSQINKAAYLFGGLFVLQGILLTDYGFRKNPVFEIRNDKFSYISIAFFLFAMLVYPVLGFYNGHIYPSSPTFGLPCPTTIFTLGMFLLLRPKMPVYLWVIPVLWSVIGFTASFTLGVYEDIGLLISAVIFIVTVMTKKTKLVHSK